MNTFHRTAAVLLVLLIATAAALVLVVAAGVAPAGPFPGQTFSQELGVLASMRGTQRLTAVLLAGVVLLGMVGLLFAEARSLRRPPPLRIPLDGAGSLTIERDSVRLLAEKAGWDVPGVRRIRCGVDCDAEGLRLTCHASLALGSAVPEAGADLQGRIKASVEQLTGLPVARVEVKVRFETAEPRTRAVQ